MKKILSVGILVLAFAGGFLLFYWNKTALAPVPVNNQTANQNTEQNWPPRVDERENVTVTVTPLDLSIDSKEWKFDVVMNTHSVELDQDMVEATTLIDNPGEEYKPLRWEGAGPGGHHREGTLVFAPIKPYSQHLSLIIKGIGDKDRAFAWILNGE